MIILTDVAPSPHAMGGERCGDAFQSPNVGLASGPAGWDDGCGGGRWGDGSCGFSDTSPQKQAGSWGDGCSGSGGFIFPVGRFVIIGSGVTIRCSI